MSPEPVAPNPAKRPDVVLTVGVDAGPALAQVDRMQRALDNAEAATPVSPRLSFRGWLLSVWIYKNKDYVKKVLAPCSAILAGGALDKTILKYAAIALGLGALTIAAKLGWDAFDYFVSDGPQ